jgi:phosphate:Na+ symporter
LQPGTFVIINLLGGIALLLWGVRMVRTGVMRAWGDRLKRFIEIRLTSQPRAFLGGAIGTAILGSGTAMALIVAGIAASGAIGAARGLAVLLGSDVGSAVVSSLFASGSSRVAWVSPLLLFAGYVVFSSSREFRPHNVGRILIGLGLVLLALSLISSATAPLREATLFHQVLTEIAREPVLAFLTGAVLAWLCHSTLAVMLLVASFLANGSLELGGAFGMILGLNAGGGLPAVMATTAMPAQARRLPLANFFCRGLAAIVCLAFAARFAPYLARLPLPAVEIATGFHTAFNVAVGLIFLPLASLLEHPMRRLLPDPKEAPDNLAQPRYLDRSTLTTPAVALVNAALETGRMSELLERMFNVALAALKNSSLETLKELKGLDERLNAYQASVHGYLSELTQSDLDPAGTRRALELMLYASNLEHAGDVIHLNLTDRIKAKAKADIAFTAEQKTALDELCAIVAQALKLAAGVAASGDVEGAKHLIERKAAFRRLEQATIGRQFLDGSAGRRANLRSSALFVDLVRDLQRVLSHIASAGYPIMDAAGLLRESRLRTKGKPRTKSTKARHQQR